LPVKKHNISLKTCRSNKARRFLIALLFFVTCATALIGAFNSAANAAEVTLAWHVSQISDVSGYKLYSRQCLLNEECTLSMENSEAMTIPLSELGQNQSDPQYTVHNLSDEHQFAFAVTIYNNSGEESGLSNQVVFTPPNAPDDSTPDDSNTPANQPPVVNAGQDQTIAIGAGEITLAGDVKDDGLPEDGSATTEWKLKAGPDTAEIENASGLTTKVTFKQSGTYTFELTATDGELTASDTVIITVTESTSGDSDDNPPPPTDDDPPPTDDDSTSDQTDNANQIIVIDNSDLDLTSSSGIWRVSKGANPNGDDSLFAQKGATFTYHFTCPETGTYDLASWWTYYSSRYNSRSRAVDISIQTDAGEKHVSVDQTQKQNAARWFSLGQYQFTAGDTYDITVIAGSKGTTCADAIQLSYVSTDTNSASQDSNSEPQVNDGPLIIDNLDQLNTITTGNWLVSKGKNPYAANSVYGKKGATFTFEFESLSTGMQDVSIWWTYYKSRSNAVPVTIESENNPVTKKVNQHLRQNGGKWNSLGQYKFVKGQIYSITITAPKEEKNKTACADAVKIE
jgi:hypothetical protein